MTTLKEIAEYTGFSVTTVSRVLNHSASDVGISIKTQRAILAAAKELNYQPNYAARGLKTGKADILALIVRDIANPFFSEVASIVQDRAQIHGYDLLLYNSKNPGGGEGERERHILDSISRWPIAGLIICQDTQVSDEDLERLRRQNIAIVMISPLLHKDVDAVFIDDRQAAFDATAYLIGKGHRRIACLTGPLEIPTASGRLAGYLQALQEHGIAYDPSLILDASFTMEGGLARMRELLEADRLPTAVFCCNDVIAIGALRAALRHGLSVPDDMAIMGFDNIGVFAYPELTTVDHNHAELGRTAVDLLVHRLQHPADNERKVVVLPHSLVIRDTA